MKNPTPSSANVFWGEMAACDHFVQIYENDATFLDTLEGFISGGLGSGESAIVIATPEHLAALDDRMRARGIEVGAALLQKRYFPLDARATLARFMVNGWPDEERFRDVVLGLLERASADGRKVRAFGEMVAVLWAEGHHGAVVRLEHLWTQLCKSEAFALFCAYPKAGFTADALESITNVCALHTHQVNEGHPPQLVPTNRVH